MAIKLYVAGVALEPSPLSVNLIIIQVDDDLISRQGSPSPVLRDETEEPMLEAVFPKVGSGTKNAARLRDAATGFHDHWPPELGRAGALA